MYTYEKNVQLIKYAFNCVSITYKKNLLPVIQQTNEWSRFILIYIIQKLKVRNKTEY